MHKCSTTTLWIADICISISFLFPAAPSHCFFAEVLVLFLICLSFPLHLEHLHISAYQNCGESRAKQIKTLQFKIVSFVAGSTCTAVQYTIMCRHCWHWETVHHLSDSRSTLQAKQHLATWIQESNIFPAVRPATWFKMIQTLLFVTLSALWWTQLFSCNYLFSLKEVKIVYTWRVLGQI